MHQKTLTGSFFHFEVNKTNSMSDSPNRAGLSASQSRSASPIKTELKMDDEDIIES